MASSTETEDPFGGSSSPAPPTSSTSSDDGSGSSSSIGPTTTSSTTGPTSSTGAPTTTSSSSSSSTAPPLDPDGPVDYACYRHWREHAPDDPDGPDYEKRTRWKYVAYTHVISHAVKNRIAVIPKDEDPNYLSLNDGIIGWMGDGPLNLSPQAQEIASLMGSVRDLRYGSVQPSTRVVFFCGTGIPCFQIEDTEQVGNFKKSLETFNAVAIYVRPTLLVDEPGDRIFVADKDQGIFLVKMAPTASELIVQRADLRDVTGERVANASEKPHPSIFACDAGKVYRYDYVEQDDAIAPELWYTWVETVVFEAPLMTVDLLPNDFDPDIGDPDFPYASEIRAVEWSSLGMLAVALEWVHGESRSSVTWFIHPVTGSICASVDTQQVSSENWNRPYVVTRRFVKKLVDGGTRSSAINEPGEAIIPAKQTFLGIISTEFYRPNQPHGDVSIKSWAIRYPESSDTITVPYLEENPSGRNELATPDSEISVYYRFNSFLPDPPYIEPVTVLPTEEVSSIDWCLGEDPAGEGDRLPILLRGRAELAAAGGGPLESPTSAAFWLRKAGALFYDSIVDPELSAAAQEFYRSPLRSWIPCGDPGDGNGLPASPAKNDLALDRMGRVLVLASDQAITYRRVSTYPYFVGQVPGSPSFDSGEFSFVISTDTVNGPKIRRIDVPPNADLFAEHFGPEVDAAAPPPSGNDPVVSSGGCSLGAFTGRFIDLGVVGNQSFMAIATSQYFPTSAIATIPANCMQSGATYIALSFSNTSFGNSNPTGIGGNPPGIYDPSPWHFTTAATFKQGNTILSQKLGIQDWIYTTPGVGQPFPTQTYDLLQFTANSQSISYSFATTYVGGNPVAPLTYWQPNLLVVRVDDKSSGNDYLFTSGSATVHLTTAEDLIDNANELWRSSNLSTPGRWRAVVIVEATVRPYNVNAVGGPAASSLTGDPADWKSPNWHFQLGFQPSAASAPIATSRLVEIGEYGTNGIHNATAMSHANIWNVVTKKQIVLTATVDVTGMPGTVNTTLRLYGRHDISPGSNLAGNYPADLGMTYKVFLFREEAFGIQSQPDGSPFNAYQLTNVPSGRCPVIAFTSVPNNQTDYYGIQKIGDGGGIASGAVLTRQKPGFYGYQLTYSDIEWKPATSNALGLLKDTYAGDVQLNAYGTDHWIWAISPVSPTTPAPSTTTPVPTTTTPSPGDSWNYGWVYMACSDGVRSYREADELAFIAHSDCTGITCADGPAVYFATGNGDIYYCPPNLSKKVRIFRDTDLKFTDLAYDHVNKRIIAVHGEYDSGNRPVEGVVLSMKLDGTDVKKLIDNRGNLRTKRPGTTSTIPCTFIGPLGSVDIDATTGLLYTAGSWTNIVYSTARLESGRRPGEVQNLQDVFPALVDTTDVIDVDNLGNYNLDDTRRRSQWYPEPAAIQFPFVNFALRPSTLLGSAPEPTTTSPAPTTTTVPPTTTTAGPTTTTTAGPTTTTGTGGPTTTTGGPTSTTTAGPTTTTAAPTTTTTLPPIDPGDSECWESVGNVQLLPSTKEAKLTARADGISELSQLIEELTPGVVMTFKIQVTRADRPLIIQLVDGETSTVLNTVTATTTGAFQVIATVPESGSIRIVLRITSNPSAQVVIITKPSLRACMADEGFSPQTTGNAMIEGTLTLGDISLLLDTDQSLADCIGNAELPDITVEPARIMLATGLSIKRWSVYNERRTRLSTDAECRGITYDTSIPAYVQNYSGLPDNIRLAGGYQTTVVQNPVSGDLTVTSIIGGGDLGTPPGELPMFVGEAPPPDRTYLDGGLACHEVLRSINGVPGPNLQINADIGVLIGNDPLTNRVIINVNGEGISSCPQFESPEQVECLAPRSNDCGLAPGADVVCPGEPDNRDGYKVIVVGGSTTTASPNLPPTIDTRAVTYDSIPSTGVCTFRRLSGVWVQQSEEAVPTWCECLAPTFYGYENQVVRVTAQPIKADPITKLRNAYFIDTPALRFWTVTSGSLVTEDEERDPEELPYISLNSGGKLTQNHLPMTAGSYRVQLTLDAEESTTIRIRISSATSGYGFYLDEQIIPSGRTEYQSESFNLPNGQIQFELTAAGNIFVFAPSLV